MRLDTKKYLWLITIGSWVLIGSIIWYVNK